MANQEHVNLLKQGVAQWNTWRKQQQIQLDPSDAGLLGAILSRADLRDATLSGDDLSGADLSFADLSRANLRDANLRDAILSDADLRDAILSHADMSRCILRHADMSRATLSRADLSRADLGGSILIDAELSGAILSGVILIDADLSRANLIDANLGGANLSGTNLSGADLSRAILSRAILSEAILIDADLSRVRVSQTIFATINLRTTKGLAEIQHYGPSSVTLNTIQLPSDGSALHFLRGVGLPDEWIDFWRATIMHPVQYHSCFISYSNKDDALARRLHADLQVRGVRCWFAPEDMRIGDKIRVRVDEAIHLQEKLLLLLSEHALASAWVEDEVEAALEKEQLQEREVLFPIRLDDAVMHTSQAWAAKLRRTRHIGDFTHWADPQAYEHAFERLLQDLKVEYNTKEGKDGESRTS